MADENLLDDPELPNYIPAQQRPIFQPRFNTYRAPGFGTRVLSTTGNVQPPAPETPAPAPAAPAGLRGIFAARDIIENSPTRYGTTGPGGHSAGVPSMARAPSNLVDVEPGFMSLAGFSTGTGVDRFGNMYDTTTFNPLGLAGTAIGGVAGVPGVGLAGDLIGDRLGLTSGIGDETRMLGDDGRPLNLFQVLANPDAYSPREVAIAQRNLQMAQQNIRPAATPERGSAPGSSTGVRGVTADGRDTVTGPTGPVPTPAFAPQRTPTPDLTNPASFTDRGSSTGAGQTTGARALGDRSVVGSGSNAVPGPAATPDRTPAPPPPPAPTPVRTAEPERTLERGLERGSSTRSGETTGQTASVSKSQSKTGGSSYGKR